MTQTLELRFYHASRKARRLFTFFLDVVVRALQLSKATGSVLSNEAAFATDAYPDELLSSEIDGNDG